MIGTSDEFSTQLIDAGTNLTLDVLALRRGEALQRFREISLCTPLNYRSQIKAHFGVDVGSELSGMSTYIGGEASSLDISEVVNTNITESNEALIAGKGVGTGQSNENFYAKDWGVLSLAVGTKSSQFFLCCLLCKLFYRIINFDVWFCLPSLLM